MSWVGLQLAGLGLPDAPWQLQLAALYPSIQTKLAKRPVRAA